MPIPVLFWGRPVFFIYVYVFHFCCRMKNKPGDSRAKDLLYEDWGQTEIKRVLPVLDNVPRKCGGGALPLEV